MYRRSIIYLITYPLCGVFWLALCPILGGCGKTDGVAGNAVVPQLVAGVNHNCVILTTSGLKCWGNNENGQIGNLGSGLGQFVSIPLISQGLYRGVKSVALGENHTCVLLSTNKIGCWGWNAFGQLGDSTTTDRSALTTVSTLPSGILKITSGWNHTCALISDNTVQCWGYNRSGQVGNGNPGPPLNSPTTVVGLSAVSAIAAGANHSCALLSSGQVQCWGDNAYGQLGDGTTTNRGTPATVLNLSGATLLSAGAYHTCAILNSGGITCWGQNQFGQLGDGNKNQNALLPVNVSGLSGQAIAVSSGGYHTCAIIADGSVNCWGDNTYHQLGDGISIPTSHLTPNPVVGLQSHSTLIGAGYRHTCEYETSSNQITCWGSNSFGQLGDATAQDRSSPVAVIKSTF